ncbi:hypothetical protein IC235_13235 [Hymenobacter sp. BT664]|uniref:Uncharacterized protein n=1 Tax=Hymenobacter montanus TaxID=2771359 RepID=A0A927BF78_9BACT|nr:hypothetical protein [Hymenobacter montanus]
MRSARAMPEHRPPLPRWAAPRCGGPVTEAPGRGP